MTVASTLDAEVEPTFVLRHRDHSTLRARLTGRAMPQDQSIGNQLRTLMHEREIAVTATGRVGKHRKGFRSSGRARPRLPAAEPSYIAPAPARLF